MKIDDLYFGVMYLDMNGETLIKDNLFAIPDIKHSVAYYTVHKNDKDYKIDNPLTFCFIEVWGKYEYEFTVGNLSGTKSEKISVYDMFVKPNADYLMSLVEQVTVESAKAYLKKEKRYRR